MQRENPAASVLKPDLRSDAVVRGKNGITVPMKTVLKAVQHQKKMFWAPLFSY